jgi:hypothetical protein
MSPEGQIVLISRYLQSSERKWLTLNLILHRSFKSRKRPRLDKLDSKQEKQDGDDKVKLEDATKMDTKGNGSSEQLDV